jgi:ADP-ribose pyrophosphatase YjhB (NUDIX family)
MSELELQIRNAARAVIIRDGQILLLKKVGGNRPERYALPGGAQDAAESLTVALQRECEEEIGTRVTIGRLAHVAEFCKTRDTEPPSKRHLVEFLFLCEVPDGYQAHSGHHPDKHQVGVLWADPDQLRSMTLFPAYLGDCLRDLSLAENPFYLGMFDDDAAS